MPACHSDILTIQPPNIVSARTESYFIIEYNKLYWISLVEDFTEPPAP